MLAVCSEVKMSASSRLRCVAGVLLASALVAACRGRMERSGGVASNPSEGQGGPPASVPGGPGDPRATGQSEFGGVPPPGWPGSGPHTRPSVANESPSGIEPGETAVVAGSTLHALSTGGLQLVEIGEPAGLLARVPIPGVPRALFVAAGTAYAVMGTRIRLPPCPACPGQVQATAGSFVAVVDVSDPRSPRLRARLPLPGNAIGAALDSSGLHVVLRHGDGWAPLPAGHPGSSLVSLDVTDPAAPAERARLDIPAPSWIEEVRFAPGVVYLAVYGRQYWAGDRCQLLGADPPPDGANGCTRLLAVDLQTGRPGASLELPGRVEPGASDFQAGVLRAFVIPSVAAERTSPRLITLTTRTAAELRPLGSLELSTAATGPVRFSDTHAYLWRGDEGHDRFPIVDLRDPARPVLGGRLEMPGRLGRVVSASAGRLVTTGIESEAPFCALGQLSIFDVSDLASPKQLASQPSGLTASLHGGLTAGDDLLVLPFSKEASLGTVPEPYAPAGVQLVDVDLAQGSLRTRGRTPVGADVERTLRVGDRVVALSAQRAELLDVRDRDNPTVVGGAQLSRTVTDVRAAGDVVLQVVRDWTFGPERGNREDRFHLYLVSADAPDAAPETPTLTLDGAPYALFSHGRFFYLFRGARVAARSVEPRLEVLEVSGSALRRRGSISLAGAANFGWPRQLDGTTFVVSLWRACQPEAPANPAPAESCTVDGKHVVTPALPAYPPPAALPVAISAQPRAPGSCPGSEADFLVVDASQPDQPRVASRFRLEGEAEIRGTIEKEAAVLISHHDRAPISDRGGAVHHFVTEVRLADLDRPTLLPRVSVPGTLVAERAQDATWFTIAPAPDPARVPSEPPAGVVLSALYHPPGSPKAFLERQLLVPGAVSGPASDGERLYLTASGQIVTVDLRGPEAPVIRSRTPVPGATTSSAPLDPFRFWPRASNERPTPAPIVADVYGRVAGHLFVTLNMHTLIYALDDPDHPRLLSRPLLWPSNAAEIRPLPGNRVMAASHEWGVEVVDLSLP
jgi:hypothetical protein